MSRCSKCDGCVNGMDEYRPNYCSDEACPQGEEEPENRREARQKILDMMFGKI